MKVLFICSGNICRSPMAAEYLRHRAVREGLSHMVVDSAGVLGIEGAPASQEAIRVLGEHGLDLGRHRSRGIHVRDAQTADIVIGMELQHLEFLEARFPAVLGEHFLLRAFENGSEPQRGAPELDDPVGQDLEIFREQFRLIRGCVDHLVLYLKYGFV
jgi:protein-tyrosine-phosphatase